jgi:hypothetical protein
MYCSADPGKDSHPTIRVQSASRTKAVVRAIYIPQCCYVIDSDRGHHQMNVAWHSLWPRCPRETCCALPCDVQVTYGAEARSLTLAPADGQACMVCCNPRDGGRMLLCDGCDCGFDTTDARPQEAPGSAWAAARVAHHPPVVARGPMALGTTPEQQPEVHLSESESENESDKVDLAIFAKVTRSVSLCFSPAM